MVLNCKQERKYLQPMVNEQISFGYFFWIGQSIKNFSFKISFVETNCKKDHFHETCLIFFEKLCHGSAAFQHHRRRHRRWRHLQLKLVAILEIFLSRFSFLFLMFLTMSQIFSEKCKIFHLLNDKRCALVFFTTEGSLTCFLLFSNYGDPIFLFSIFFKSSTPYQESVIISRAPR